MIPPPLRWGMPSEPQAKAPRAAEVRTITLHDQNYYPPKAERGKEHDMPGASEKTIRRTFFRPYNVRRGGAE